MRYALLAAALLAGCASQYRSIDDVTASPPQLVETVDVPLATAYDRVLAATTRCFYQYRVNPVHTEQAGAVYVIADNAVAGGTDVWLAVELHPVADGTRVEARWGSDDWALAGERSVEWARGALADCQTGA